MKQNPCVRRSCTHRKIGIFLAIYWKFKELHRNYILENHIVLGNLPTRLFFAMFSIADGYFGTWASGCHVAAAFELPSIVHLNNHMKGWPIFPGKARIHQFMYPQHIFARYEPTQEQLMEYGDPRLKKAIMA